MKSLTLILALLLLLTITISADSITTTTSTTTTATANNDDNELQDSALLLPPDSSTKLTETSNTSFSPENSSETKKDTGASETENRTMNEAINKNETGDESRKPLDKTKDNKKEEEETVTSSSTTTTTHGSSVHPHDCMIVEQCTPCGRFERKLKHFCHPWGNKEQVECMTTNGTLIAVYQSCPLAVAVEHHAFYQILCINIILTTLSAFTIWKRRALLDALAHRRLLKQIGAV